MFGLNKYLHRFRQILGFLGRILNLETQDIKLYTWTGSIDPEESYWVETSQQRKTFINIIRLFYEAGPPAYEQIGGCREV